MAFERRIVTTYDASTAGFDRGTRRVEAGLARLERTADNRLTSIDRRFERAGRAALRLGTAIGALGTGLALNGVRQYAETWRQVERSLTAAGFAVDGNREKLTQLAVRVRGDLAQTSQAVSRFSRTTGDDLETSIRRIETLRKLLSVGGATTAEASSVSLQLLQGLQSGQLQGEELRALREAGPIELLDAIAARAGGTRGELKQLGADGKLSIEIITGALDDLAATADRKFASLAVSGSEAFEVLSTGFAAFFGRLDTELGATAGLNEFLASVGTLLNDNAEAAATFAKALEVAAVSAGALAGGRALGAVNKALVEGAAARQAAVAQGKALVETTNAEVQAKRLQVATLKRQIAADAAASKSVAERAAKTRDLSAARAALTQAETNAARQFPFAAAGSFGEKRIQQARAEVDAKRAVVQALQREVAAQNAAVLSAKQREAINRRLANATAALAAAETNATRATNALTIAQGRLSLATRVTAGALNTLKAAFAFFGGVPGIIFAAVSATVLLSDSFNILGQSAEDAIGRFSNAISDAESTASKLAETERRLEAETRNLEAANQDLAAAIETGEAAAISAASSEVQAVNKRIAANEALRQKYIEVLQAQQASFAAQAAVAQRELESEFSGESVIGRDVRDTTSILAGVTGSIFGDDPVAERIEQRRKGLEEFRAEAKRAAQELRATDEQAEFLKLDAALEEAQFKADAFADTLKRLREGGSVSGVADTPITPGVARPDSGSTGGRARATREETDALEDLIKAADRRAAQIIDEMELLTAKNAEERAYLEERQRLLNEANDKGVILDPKFVEEQSRGIARLTTDLDSLRVAKELVTEITEQELTAEEKIIRARERLQALLPSIIALVGDEARAHEILAEAVKQAEQEIRENEPLSKLAEDISAVIGQTQSFEEALNRVLAKLIEIAAQDFFDVLLGNKSAGQTVLGSLFGDLFGGFREHGGSVQAGRAYVVGEKRPELFVPDQSGTIVPRVPSEIVVPQDIGSAAPAQSVTFNQPVTINGSGLSEEQLSRAVSAALERDRPKALAAVQARFNTDGGYLRR